MKKRMGVGIVAMLLVSTLSLGFSLRAKAEGETLTLYSIKDLSKKVTVARRIQTFEQRYGIKVNILEIPQRSAQNTLLAKFVLEDSNWDVIEYVLPQNILEWAPANWLEPIDDVFRESERVKYSPATLDAVSWMGKTWAIPMNENFIYFTYRSDYLENAGFLSPPDDWDELKLMASKLTRDITGNGTTDIFGYAFYGNEELSSSFTYFLNQAGGTLFKNGKPTFNGSEGYEALHYMTELVREYFVTPPGMTSLGTPRTFIWMGKNQINYLFKTGGLAMASVETPDLLLWTPSSEYSQEIKVALPPANPKTGSRGGCSKILVSAINVYSKKKKLVRQWFEFCTSREVQKNEFLIGRNTPARLDIWEIPEVVEYFGDKEVAEVIQKTQMLNRFDPYCQDAELEKTFNIALGRTLEGEVDPKKALHYIEKKIRELYLAKYGWE